MTAGKSPAVMPTRPLNATATSNLNTTATASPGGAQANGQSPNQRTNNNANASGGSVDVAGALAFNFLTTGARAYIDPNGAFKGIVRGTWTNRGQEIAESGPTASGEKGSFRGEVLDASRNPVGAVRGHWHSRLDNTDGFLEGFWSLGCAN